MPTFGDFETTHEIARGPIYTVYEARRRGETGEARYAVKYCDLTMLGSAERVETQLRAFRAQIAAQDRVGASSEGAHWARVHGHGSTPGGEGEGAFVVLDLYGRDAEQLASRVRMGARANAADLLEIVRSVARGLRELQTAPGGRAHGNLKPTNVLIDEVAREGRRRVVLTDPGPADRADAAEDLRAVGHLIYQLVVGREHPGPAAGPVEKDDNWNALGARAEEWLDLCNELVAPELAPTLDGLLERLEEMAPKRTKSYPKRLALLGGLAAAAVIITAILWPRGGGGAVPDRAAWETYRHDWQAWFGDLWLVRFGTREDLRARADRWGRDDFLGALLDEVDPTEWGHPGRLVHEKKNPKKGEYEDAEDVRPEDFDGLKSHDLKRLADAIGAVKKTRDRIEAFVEEQRAVANGLRDNGLSGVADYADRLANDVFGPSETDGMSIAALETLVDLARSDAIADLRPAAAALRGIRGIEADEFLGKFSDLRRLVVETTVADEEDLRVQVDRVTKLSALGNKLEAALADARWKRLHRPALRDALAARTLDDAEGLRAYLGSVLEEYPCYVLVEDTRNPRKKPDFLQAEREKLDDANDTLAKLDSVGAVELRQSIADLRAQIDRQPVNDPIVECDLGAVDTGIDELEEKVDTVAQRTQRLAKVNEEERERAIANLTILVESAADGLSGAIAEKFRERGTQSVNELRASIDIDLDRETRRIKDAERAVKALFAPRGGGGAAAPCEICQPQADELAERRRREAVVSILEGHEGFWDDFEPTGAVWTEYDAWRDRVDQLLAEACAAQSALNAGYGLAHELEQDGERVRVEALAPRWEAAEGFDDLKACLQPILHRVADLARVAASREELPGWRRDVGAKEKARPEFVLAVWEASFEGEPGESGWKADGTLESLRRDEEFLTRVQVVIDGIESGIDDPSGEERARLEGFRQELKGHRRRRWLEHATIAAGNGAAGASWGALEQLIGAMSEFDVVLDRDLADHPEIAFDVIRFQFGRRIDDRNADLCAEAATFRGQLEDWMDRYDLTSDEETPELIERLRAICESPARRGLDVNGILKDRNGGVGVDIVEPADDVATAPDEIVCNIAGHTVAFRRVDVDPNDGAWAYLSVDEVSFALFRDVAVGANLWQEDPELLDKVSDVRVWDRNPAGGVDVAAEWLGDTQPDGYHDPGLQVGRPTERHPMTHIPLSTARRLAGAIGCRLPTFSEWTGAMVQPGANDENVRDATWAMQLAWVETKRAALEEKQDFKTRNQFQWPNPVTIYGRNPADTRDNYAVAPDGHVWFRETNLNERGRFLNLDGNVAELVEDSGSVRVAGRSALSQPTDRGRPRVREGDAFADVGLRLAFTLKDEMLGPSTHAQLSELLAEYGYRPR